MTRDHVQDFGEFITVVTGAFLVRNASVIFALLTLLLFAFSDL